MMEFAWNTQKNGISDIKGLEKEQEREGKISNKEIDQSKTQFNYDLVKSDLNLYQRVKQRVEEVRPVSRIQKNSVVDYSNIITVPKDQAKEWGVDKSKEYLKEVYNYFCKELGKENVVSAKVHLDETAPHMHLHFVPVSREGKLQARKVITPSRINKIHSEAPSYLQERGFDVIRGIGKTEKSLEIHEFKTKNKENELVRKEKELEKNIYTVNNRLDELKGIEKSINELEHVETKRSLLGAKITLKEGDYKNILDMAKKSSTYSLENREMKTENERLKDENKSLRQSSEHNFNKITELKQTNKSLKNEYDSLHEQAQGMYNVLKENGLLTNAQKEILKIRDEKKMVQKQNDLKKSRSWDMER